MIYKVVVSQFTKMLGNLLAILDETAKYAEEKNFDVEELLQFRLAPDQFNLMRQLQIACDTAKFGAARLTDTEKSAPEHIDSEKTLSEIRGASKALSHIWVASHPRTLQTLWSSGSPSLAGKESRFRVRNT